MSSQNDAQDLHGSAPDKSATAVLLIDVINDLDFPEADQLLPYAMRMAESLSKFLKRCRAASLPILYINDNFGKWRSDFTAVVEHCMRQNSLGAPIVEALRPAEDDYFVLKPKHSGFYSSSLDILLRHLEAKRLIVCGMAGNICVLFTANDAYMRGFELVVPRDCIASNTAELNEYAIKQMESLLDADIRESTQISDEELGHMASE